MKAVVKGEEGIGLDLKLERLIVRDLRVKEFRRKILKYF